MSDSATCFGAGYTEGLGPMLEGGDTVVAILGPQGAVRLEERHPRSARRMHAPDDPYVWGIAPMPELDQVLVRLSRPDMDQEEWRIYDLREARHVATLVPSVPTPEGGLPPWIASGRPVAGTPLLLIHWYWVHRRGAVFELVDRKGSQVWSLVLPGDYEEDWERFGTGCKRAAQAGLGIPTSPPGTFSVVSAAARELITYGVKRNPIGEAWVVEELERSEHEGLSLGPEPIPDPPPAEPMQLQPLGKIALQCAPREPESRVVEWCPVEGGVETIVDQWEGGLWWVALREDGSESGRVLIEPPPTPSRCYPRWVRLRSGVWLYVIGGKGGAWRFDPANPEMKEVQQYPRTSVGAVAAGEDGGFAVTWKNGGFTTAFDDDGVRRWRVATQSANDVCVTTGGDVAVVTSVGDEVTILGKEDGRVLRTIELSEACGREPNYPSGIVAAPDGGVLVHDFMGEPNLWRIGPRGGRAEGIRLQLSEGHSPEELAYQARYTDDGRLWSCDGRAFYRFAEDYVADLIVGRPIRNEQLEDPGEARAGPGGRLHVLDRRDGEVHVFDREGRLLHRCVPGPDDFPDVPYFGHIAVDGDGHVLVAREDSAHDDGYLHFDAEGRRLGILPIRGGTLTFQRGADAAWIDAYDEAVHLDGDWQPIRYLQRRMNNRWLRDIRGLAAGDDGTLAVFDGALTIFEADGTHRATFENRPGGFECARGSGWIATGGGLEMIWLISESDGARFSFAIDPENGEGFIDLTAPPGLDELWVFDRDHRIVRRYAWPEHP